MFSQSWHSVYDLSHWREFWKSSSHFPCKSQLECLFFFNRSPILCPVSSFSSSHSHLHLFFRPFSKEPVSVLCGKVFIFTCEKDRYTKTKVKVLVPEMRGSQIVRQNTAVKMRLKIEQWEIGSRIFRETCLNYENCVSNSELLRPHQPTPPPLEISSDLHDSRKWCLGMLKIRNSGIIRKTFTHELNIKLFGFIQFVSVSPAFKHQQNPQK